MAWLLDFIMWALPSGGFGAAVAWLAGGGMRRTREAKEVHDTYKQMYVDVSEELTQLRLQSLQNYEKTEELIRDNTRTRRSLNRLSRAIEAIQLCPYRAACPVRAELQDRENSREDSEHRASGSRPSDSGERQHHDGHSSLGPSGDCLGI